MVHAVAALSASLFLLGITPSLETRHTIVNIVGYVLYVPEYPAMIVRNIAMTLSNWFIGRDELNKKIEDLSKEVELLRIENSAMSSKITRMEFSVPTEHAEVVVRNPDSWWSEIRINAGVSNGLDVGSPIYSGGFLIGRISSIEGNFSWVELLTSSSLMLPIVVEETRDLGVIGGDGEGNVWLHYVPENRGIKEGMTISTALVGNKLPPGLRIGTISGESIISPNGFRSMRVAIGADLSKLYSVSFIKPEGVGQ